MRRIACGLVLMALCAAAFAAETSVKIPKQGWAITFDSPALFGQKDSNRGDEYAFKARAGRFNLTLYVENPHAPGDTHKDCYSWYWPQASKNQTLAKDSVVMTETAQYVRVQYDLVTPFQGKPVRDRNVNYYFAYKGKWVDVHISVIAPEKQDEALFAAFDKSLVYGP